jgi:hypothetical protein
MYDLCVLALGGTVFAQLGTHHFVTAAEFYVPVRHLFIVVSALGAVHRFRLAPGPAEALRSSTR